MQTLPQGLPQESNLLPVVPLSEFEPQMFIRCSSNSSLSVWESANYGTGWVEMFVLKDTCTDGLGSDSPQRASHSMTTPS